MKFLPTQKILAIESSCDETALAVVDGYGRVHYEKLHSQIEIHKKYGGVVPEVASRSHFEAIQDLMAELQNQILPGEIAAVAATMGPGLIGPLLVGSNLARGLAFGWNVPFIGVHHLRGHIASAVLDGINEKSLLERSCDIFPAWVAIVSGGHSQILSVQRGLFAHKILDTADDAAGECLDKCAKLMGLSYPGGPAIEKAAATLSPEEKRVAEEISAELPRPKSAEGFSFSGLKTAFRLLREKSQDKLSISVLSYAIQESVFDSLLRGLEGALKKLPANERPKKLLFCGGVAANQTLRKKLLNLSQRYQMSLHLPPIKYSTDNAVMIACAAWIQARELDLVSCEARIPLETV